MGAKRETVIVVRKPKVDKLKPASGPTAEISIRRCFVIPRASQEAGSGWVQTAGFTVIAPLGADVRADDQIRIRGELYAVVGTPGAFPVRKGKPGLFVTTERVAKVGT